MFRFAWYHHSRVLALGIVLAGTFTVASSNVSAASTRTQRAGVTSPATLPLDRAAIAAPVKGCVRIEYNSPIVNAQTGVVEGHGVVTALACDQSSAPTQAESRRVFVGSRSPISGSGITADTGLTYRGTWSPNCSYNQQLVAAPDSAGNAAIGPLKNDPD